MAAPAFLTKQYGPFTGTIWVVVIVGGVGLGLAMRKFMGSGDSMAVGGDSATTSPAFSPGITAGNMGTQYNQGDIVNDVVEAIRIQTPPPATTNPDALLDLDKQIAGLKGQLAQLVALEGRMLRERQRSSDAEHREFLRNDLRENTNQMDAIRVQIAGLEAQKRAGVAA